MIEKYEGLRLHSYQDIVGVWTIGYGNTGPDIGPDLIWTKEQCDDALSHRLAEEFEPGVLNAIGAAPTTQGQFDAMVSLAYNIGVHAFAGSTVARKHIAGDYGAAADAFALWNKAGGRVLQALADRRAEEAQVYADATPAPPVPVPPLPETPEMQLLNKIYNLLVGLGARPITSVRFGVPRFSDLKGNIMPASLTIPAADKTSTVPMIFANSAGAANPPTDGAVTDGDVAVATAALSADGKDVTVTRAATAGGTCVITYTGGGVTNTLDVIVEAEVLPLTSVEFDTAHATFA
jgi:lysozyme